MQRVPRAVLWLRRMIRDVHPDIVHIHSLGVYGALALPSTWAGAGSDAVGQSSYAPRAVQRQELQ